MNVKSYSSKNVEKFISDFQENDSTNFNPTLAICFSDALYDFKTLSKFLVSKDIEVLGTTTCGEIHDDQIAENSCSILLIEINKSYFNIQLQSFVDCEIKTAENIALIAKEKFNVPSIVTYASKIGVNGDAVVKGYKNILAAETPIFGGLAGDNFRNDKFTVFHNEVFETNGLVALIVDGEKIKIEGKSFSGWQVLGKTHIITKAEKNVIYEIDNQPALELFIEYFGVEKATSEKGEQLEKIPASYPLKVINDQNLEYMRSPLHYDVKNKSIVLAGEVNQGEAVKFCPMPDLEVVDKTVSFFKNYALQLPKVDLIIINSCAGRKASFGPMMKKEIKGIYNIWNAPTAGFMALGEIGSHALEANCNFHNVTCSLMTMTKL